MVAPGGGGSLLLFGAWPRVIQGQPPQADDDPLRRHLGWSRPVVPARGHAAASGDDGGEGPAYAVSYTHLRAHETVLDLVFRLLLEKTKYIYF